MQVEPGLHPVQHGLGRADLGLPDGPCRLDIDDHAMIRVDQVIVGIAEECWPLARRGPLAGRVGMRGELGLDLAGGPEGRLIQRVEILAHRAGCFGRVNPCGVPLLLRRRVLVVRVCFDEAGVDRHALAADQALSDAARHRHLEQVTQQFAVSKPARGPRRRAGTAQRGSSKVIRHCFSIGCARLALDGTSRARSGGNTSAMPPTGARHVRSGARPRNRTSIAGESDGPEIQQDFTVCVSLGVRAREFLRLLRAMHGRRPRNCIKSLKKLLGR